MDRRLPLQTWIRRTGWILTVVVIVLVLFFSLSPPGKSPNVSWIPFGDKGGHLLAYAAYGFSSFLATLQIPGSSTRRRRRTSTPNLHISSWAGRSIFITLVSGTLLGAAVELVQPLCGRSAQWGDLLADFMGLIVGLAVVLILLKIAGSYFVTRPWLYDPNWEEGIDEQAI